MAVINQLPHSTGGGGGSETETLLWENPSPTASFAAQTVTLSEPIANGATPLVKGLKVVYKRTTAASGAVYTTKYFMPDDLSEWEYAAEDAVFSFSFTTSSYKSTRTFGMAGDDKIRFGGNFHTNSTSATNTQCIPIEIYAIKES